MTRPDIDVPLLKTYLGDGLYAAYDGYHVIITAENGVQVTQTVYLEAEVFSSLVSWHAGLLKAIQDSRR